MNKDKSIEHVNEPGKSISKHIPNIDEHHRELRRSRRFPVKPRRYEPEDLTSFVRNKQKLKSEYIKSTPKTKRKKAGPVSKDKRDCFFSKTESDTSKLTSAQKKCQRKEKDDAVNQHETQSKKTHLIKNSKLKKPIFKITNEHKENNLSIVKQIVYPTAEEIEENERREREQIKVNRKMKAMLQNLVQVPEKVKILSLNNMTSDEILNTLPKYKIQLDIIFRELRSKPRVDDYKGINHYSVIELIDHEKQLKMMHKLGEVYEAEQDGISQYPTLFANALMPEWLVHIFKDKYEFSHTEAVSHLNKQRQYMQYLGADDYH
ncbi:uncharacterized protein LOC120768887 isoform X1 [Bactrocera tryoni]|uniref:uncharacterized protein LOC120768887 isoform X1 n=1 Tax=Bactrocera tryoni TaxID=59916 RepID=UPI001A9795F7|nr:uncharacterized protein LOC120768887 isoform X1 [Bactrocera tryoni]